MVQDLDILTLASQGQSGATFLSIPFVQPRELIFAILIPFTPPLQVILIVQPAADCTAAGQVLTDVFPLHAVLTKLDDLRVLLGRPF